MTILSREAVATLRDIHDRNCSWCSTAASPDEWCGHRKALDTARALHDLRDAVLALCDMEYPKPGLVEAVDIREAVARVERGEA